MNNLNVNILLDADAVAHMVLHIRVPDDMALMGIAPILTILFGTDNTASIMHSLKTLNLRDSNRLVEKVRDVIASDHYPLSETVWQFNDPLADIKVLETALGTPENTSDQIPAMTDLQCMMETLSGTFPFLEIGSGAIADSDILEFAEDHSVEVAAPARIHRNPVEPPHGAGVWIVPSLAAGSLMLLGSKINQ